VAAKPLKVIYLIPILEVKRENSIGALSKFPIDVNPVSSPFRERWVEGSRWHMSSTYFFVFENYVNHCLMQKNKCWTQQVL